MAELFPFCRSITGEGVRQTLRAIASRIPLEIHEVPSGTHVLDWTVPDEWNIDDAFIAGPGGERVVDFGASNLHIVSYSEPVRTKLSLDELRPHLHTLPDHPAWVPYRTSYYADNWGFCLSDEALEQIRRETEDRYGRLPESVERLFAYGRLRRTAEEVRVVSIDRTPTGLAFKLKETARVSPERLLALVGEGRASFSPSGVLRVEAGDEELIERAHRVLLDISAGG